MAHNLEYNSQRGTNSFFSRKELAWHGLGQIIQEAVTPEEAIKLANLDYKVELKPLYTSYIPDGHNAFMIKDSVGQTIGYNLYDRNNNFVKVIQKKGELIITNKAVSRMDNYTTLGIVGNKYTPVQNTESINFIYDILKHNPDIKEKDDIIIETAGVLGIGERIFVTAKLPKGFRIGEEQEDTELYIVFTNSHNGTSSLTALITPIRVVCNNTLTAALGSNKSKVTFRHTANISTAMKEGMHLLNLSYVNFKANEDLYNSLAKIKVDSKMIDDLVFKSMLPDNKYILVNKMGIDNVSIDDISTRLRNQMRDAIDYVHYGVGQNTNKGTAYWAYMGINSYINNGVGFKDYESKFDGLINGNYSKLDSQVLSNAMLL